MTTTSQPAAYSPTSSDTINTATVSGICSLTTIDTSDIINYTLPQSYTFGGSTVTISSGSASYGTVPPLTAYQISGSSAIDTYSVYPVEWKTCFPDWNRIQHMCNEYPGLAIAFDKFKTTYKLVADHYDTPKDKRPKP